MELNEELKLAYDNLIRRVKLLRVKKHNTCKHPISLRLTDAEMGIVENMTYIFGLNKSQIIKLCIQDVATHLAAEEEIKRLNNKVEGV